MNATKRGVISSIRTTRSWRGGHLVAFTDIGVWAQDPCVAEQWNTIVDPGHRGHRRGLAAKVAGLRHLRREIPGALRLETWNAIENYRMIAINELPGIQIVERVDEFQLVFSSRGFVAN